MSLISIDTPPPRAYAQDEAILADRPDGVIPWCVDRLGAERNGPLPIPRARDPGLSPA